MFHFSIDTRFPYLIIFVLGTVSFLLTIFEKPIRTRFYLTPPLVLTCIGIMIRSIIDSTHNYETTPDWEALNNFLMDMSQFVIAIQLMASALDLPIAFWRDRWITRSLFLLLIPGMILTWLITAGLLYAILYNITSFRVCLLIAACLTPTDPILAHTVVVGAFAEKHIPQHVRDVLSAESSFNDGTAYPFVQFGVYLLTSPYSDSSSLFTGQWLAITWLYEIGVGVLLSAVMGYGFGKLHGWCYHRKMIAHTTTIPIPFFLVLAVLGACDLCAVNGVLGTFVAGCIFSLEDTVHQQMAAVELQDTADIMANIFFILFGVYCPFSDMGRLLSPAQIIILIVAIMLLKRLPVLLLLQPLFPKGTTTADQVFMGWFGPIGVAGFYYITFINYQNRHEDGSLSFDDDTMRLISCVVSLIIMSSVVGHALSCVPLTKMLSAGFSAPSRSLAMGHLEQHIKAVEQQRHAEVQQELQLHKQVQFSQDDNDNDDYDYDYDYDHQQQAEGTEGNTRDVTWYDQQHTPPANPDSIDIEMQSQRQPPRRMPFHFAPIVSPPPWHNGRQPWRPGVAATVGSVDPLAATISMNRHTSVDAGQGSDQDSEQEQELEQDLDEYHITPRTLDLEATEHSQMHKNHQHQQTETEENSEEEEEIPTPAHVPSQSQSQSHYQSGFRVWGSSINASPPHDSSTPPPPSSASATATAHMVRISA